MDAMTMNEARELLAAFRAVEAEPLVSPTDREWPTRYTTALDNCEEFARINAVDLLSLAIKEAHDGEKD